MKQHFTCVFFASSSCFKLRSNLAESNLASAASTLLANSSNNPGSKQKKDKSLQYETKASRN